MNYVFLRVSGDADGSQVFSSLEDWGPLQPMAPMDAQRLALVHCAAWRASVASSTSSAAICFGSSPFRSRLRWIAFPEARGVPGLVLNPRRSLRRKSARLPMKELSITIIIINMNHMYICFSVAHPPGHGHGLVMVPTHPPLWTCGGCGWVGSPPPPCGPVVVVDALYDLCMITCYNVMIFTLYII